MRRGGTGERPVSACDQFAYYPAILNLPKIPLSRQDFLHEGGGIVIETKGMVGEEAVDIGLRIAKYLRTFSCRWYDSS
jgi:hypothetical protein